MGLASTAALLAGVVGPGAFGPGVARFLPAWPLLALVVLTYVATRSGDGGRGVGGSTSRSGARDLDRLGERYVAGDLSEEELERELEEALRAAPGVGPAPGASSVSRREEAASESESDSSDRN